MFGFVSEKKYKAALALAERESAIATLARIESMSLKRQLREQRPQFTGAEIESMIRLCHPDKHNNSPTSNDITKKLLALRSK